MIKNYKMYSDKNSSKWSLTLLKCLLKRMGTHPYCFSTSDSERQCFLFSTQFQIYIVLIISNNIDQPDDNLLKLNGKCWQNYSVEQEWFWTAKVIHYALIFMMCILPGKKKPHMIFPLVNKYIEIITLEKKNEALEANVPYLL